MEDQSSLVSNEKIDRIPNPLDDMADLESALSCLREMVVTDAQLHEVVKAQRTAGAIRGVLGGDQVLAAILLGGESADRVRPEQERHQRARCIELLLGPQNRERIVFCAGLARNAQMHVLAMNLLRMVGAAVPPEMESRAAAEQAQGADDEPAR